MDGFAAGHEIRPSGIYMNPLLTDLFDQEAKAVQLYFNEVEVIPGVIVKALPTQAGVFPLIPTCYQRASGRGKRDERLPEFILSEEFVEYHWLTSPAQRGYFNSGW